MLSTLPDLLNSSLQNRFGRRKSNLPRKCKECKWLVYCRGGCVKDWRFSPEPGGANYLCTAYKAFFEHAHPAMLRLADEPMMGELGDIDCPTAVMAGERDPYCPPKASQMIADAIPGAELTVIPGAGHCMHWESPEATNEMILRFIDSHD